MIRPKSKRCPNVLLSLSVSPIKGINQYVQNDGDGNRQGLTAKSGGDTKLPAEYLKSVLGDQLLLVYLVEVMDVYLKSGSYPESVATFTLTAPTELTLAAQRATAKVNCWRTS